MHTRFELIIVAVQIAGAVKIYVAAVKALRKKERLGSKLDEETQFGTKSSAFF
jgi:hypothetical protein